MNIYFEKRKRKDYTDLRIANTINACQATKEIMNSIWANSYGACNNRKIVFY